MAESLLTGKAMKLIGQTRRERDDQISSRASPLVVALVKRFIPSTVLRAARGGWEDLRDWIAALAFGLSFVVTRRPRPRVLLYFGYALGDDLLCTAVMRELRRRGEGPILMVSDHAPLFVANQDAGYVRPLWRRHDRDGSAVAICHRFVRIWGGRFIREEYAPLLDGDHSRPPPRHIIAEMCARAGITGSIAIRPYLRPAAEEGFWAAGRIVIQSSGMAARHPIRNKEWPAERFQGVVDALAGELSFIQVGSMADPLLRPAFDFRGGTGIRKTAAILSKARLFVGTVGFLMHLARAVDCPSVIVFGGREAPAQSGYACNLNLYSAVPCAPCWRWDGCEFDRRCMGEITVTDVVAAIRQMLARPRGPLAVETAVLAATAVGGDVPCSAAGAAARVSVTVDLRRQESPRARPAPA